jgi:hypothetical protein
VVLLNLSDDAALLDGVHGTVTVATDRALEGTQVVGGGLTLAPWDGAVLASAAGSGAAGG